MKKTGRYAAVAVLAVAALLAGACTNTRSRHVDRDGVPEDVVFPNIDEAKAKKRATSPSPEDLRRIVNGMNKKEISQLIGPPHFHEMLGAREWDYTFRYWPQGQNEPKVCQYKVVFDTDRIARSFYWNPVECRQLMLGQ